MKGKPKYSEGDSVKFYCSCCGVKEGFIVFIDAWGTFEDDSDVSYDIMVDSEGCLYKHVREDSIIDGD